MRSGAIVERSRATERRYRARPVGVWQFVSPQFVSQQFRVLTVSELDCVGDRSDFILSGPEFVGRHLVRRDR